MTELLNEKALEAAVLAHDKEEAAMRGEPDPWAEDRPEQEFSDRTFAMGVAIHAYLSALEATPPAPKVTDEMVERACAAFEARPGLLTVSREAMRAALTAAQESGQ